MIAVPGEDDAPRRVLTIQSRAVGRRSLAAGFAGVQVAAFIAHPAPPFSGFAWALFTWWSVCTPKVLYVSDEEVTFEQSQVRIDSIAKVRRSFLHVGVITRDGRRVVVFTGGPRHNAWVARFLRYLAAHRRVPAGLLVPAASARVVPPGRKR